jgi:hypothetical protein
MGYASTLLYSGECVRRLYPDARNCSNFWAGVASIPDVELVDLDELPVSVELKERFRSAATGVAPSALAYDLHLEQADVLANLGLHGESLRALTDRMTRAGAALHEYLATHSFHRFLLYSGLIGESPLLLLAARERKLPTFCLEGWAWRPGHMMYNLNAPALEYNVSGWQRALGDWDRAKAEELQAYVSFLDGWQPSKTEWLDNFYRIQKSKVTARMPKGLARFLEGGEPLFVLAPNVIGDSSMLHRETIFPGQHVWVREVIRHFAVRPRWKLVVRAHPAEVWMGRKCVVAMGRVVRDIAGKQPNVFVIDATEKVNVFSLLPFARAGLVWLSSVGVDMVVRGVPVVAAARPKYEGLGIVEEPRSKSDYFAALDRWGERQARPTDAQVLQGKRYLYLTFKGFSFEATGRNYRATGCRLGQMPAQAEHDRFYRILVGEEPAPDLT